MRVSCELAIGNDQDHTNTSVFVEGNINGLFPSHFIDLRINGTVYEVNPSELIAAVERVRNDYEGVK
jgi:hypothetical protein